MKHLNYLRRYPLLAVLLLLAGTVPGLSQPLSGTYTVGGVSPSYSTLTAAVNDLVAKGVSGPVTLNIRDGNYNEQIIIPDIPGAGAGKRVTIKSESGNTQQCVYSFNSPSSNNFIFRITGSHITVKNLTLKSTNTTYGNVVVLGSNASYDSIHSSTLEAPVTTSTGSNMSVVFANQLFGTDNVIYNDSIKNGSMSFYVYGLNTSVRVPRFIIDGNKISNPYYAGFYFYYTEDIKVRNNIFNSTTSYTNFYTFYNYYGYNAMDISNNTINVTAPSTIYGLFAYNCTGDFVNPALRGNISGNTVTINGGSGTTYPSYIYYSDFCNISNNTISTTTTSGAINNNYYYNSYSTINKNTINCTSSTGTISGLVPYMSGNYSGGAITNNKITCTSTSGTIYGLYPQYLQNIDIVNNTVVTSTSGTTYALYSWYNRNTNYYNNSIHSNSTGSTNYAGYIYNSSSTYFSKVRNNIFSKTSTNGYTYYNYNPTYTNSDYNNIYTAAGTNLIQRGTPSLNASSIQSWRTTVGQEQNSLSYDPGYTSSSNLAPDPANPASWSLNGRGEHITGNNTDINGNPRVTSKAAGVPDLGAWEFTPTATPPAAVATPATPAASTTQVFTFGQDTVATIAWPAGSVPASISVRQYTGTIAPTVSTLGYNNMYFYADISIPSGTYTHTSNIYYKDPWTGTTNTEAGLRLAKKDGANPWTGYTPPASTSNPVRNIITTTGLNTFGLFTGIDGALNAGVSSIVSPGGTFCPGTLPVQVKVNNYGGTAINSVTLKWTVDGVAQPDVNYATTIPAWGNANVTMGNVTFAGPARTIKVWTSQPNGTPDPVIGDDTVTQVLRASLNGVYTVGGTTPDYATLAAAVTDLNTLGVCGPVTFNIRNGSYSGASWIANIKPVKGGSAVNRVTFKSETNNAANVTLSFTGTSTTNNFVFKLDTASYITIRDLTLANTATSTYSGTVQFTGTASYDSVVNCVLTTPITSVSTSSSGALIFANPVLGTDNVIKGNTFNNGAFGIYWWGMSTSIRGDKTIIDNNTFNQQRYMGIYHYYGNNLKVRNNTFTSSGSLSSGYYGLSNYYVNGDMDVSGNTMTLSTTSTGTLYGMYNSYCVGDATNNAQKVKINKNTITITSATSGAQYGIANYYNNYDTLRENTVNVSSTSSGTMYPLYNYYSANSYFLRNNFTGTSATSAANFFGLYYSPNSVFNNNKVTTSSGASASVSTYAMYYAHGSECLNDTFNIATNSPSSSYYNYGYFTYYTNGGKFNNNIINMTGAIYMQYAYLAYNCNDVLHENNTINTNNTYSSGYTYSLYAYGSSSSSLYSNNIIRNNKINSNVNYYCYGLYFPYTCRLLLENNVINLNATSYVSYALGYNYYSYDNIIRNNSVHAKANYTYYGIHTAYFQGTASYYYNNSINLQGTFGTTYANYMYSSNSTSYPGKCYFYNNIINANQSGVSYFIQAYDLTRVEMDYNMYNSPNIGTFLYTSYTGQSFTTGNLQAWRNAYGYDKNSLIYPPAFANAGTGDLHANINNPDAWAMNGRGRHMPGNTLDADGLPRPVTQVDGAPDLGAYELTPAASTLPPNAAANPVAPVANAPQYFTLGQDTVAVVKWGATVPATATVKQYSGAWPPAFISPFYLNIYTDIQAAGNHTHDVDFYYKDPQRGTTAGESALRLVKKDGTNPWVGFNAPQSVADINRNIIATTALTDFGLHTGTDVSNNAGATGVNSPIAVFCHPSSQTIKAIISNLGNNIINNVQIGWSLNGIPQTPISYSTPINTVLSPAGNQAIVTLGNYNFTSGQPLNLIVYTYLPNGQVDPAPLDDTLKTKIWPGLNGTYTVGGTTPDFADVKEAVDVMNTWGVCGPVTFNIRNGNYAGNQYKLKALRINPTDRITFQSESGVAANVNITFTPATDNYIFQLQDASYYTFRNLSLTNGSGTNCRTLEISGNSQYDSVLGCILTAGTSTTTATNSAAVISIVYPAHNNTFIGNTINNGGQSMYIYGSGTASTGWLNNIVIESNTFNNPYYYGAAYCYYTGGLKFNNNTLNLSGTGYYGSYFYYPYNFEMKGNKVTDARTSGGYGGLVLYYINATIDKNTVANNVLVQTIPTFSAYGGLTVWYPSNTRFYNNSVLQVSTYNSVNYAPGFFYMSSTSYSNNEIYNNAFINKGGGPALMINDAGTNNKSDYNNLYSTGTNTFCNYSSYSNTLPTWRSATGKDRNSLSYDPGFVSNTDLHPDPNNPSSWSLNGRGIHIAGNDKDKDNNPRVTLRADGVPDIGAYEFVPGATPPACVATPAAPAAGSSQVFTFGYDTVAVVRWAPNSVVPTNITVRQYSGTKGPQFPAPGFQYFYTDINTANITYNAAADIYYKDPWLGTISNEADLRMLRRLLPGGWVAYNSNLSNADINRNYIQAQTTTSFGWFTGIEDGILFSAIITPGGSTVFCPGGSVVLQANTGAGYTYQWYLNNIAIPNATNPNYTATSAGDYTVAITNSSNVTATSPPIAVTIVAPPAALISASGPLTYCVGNGLTLNANTGIGLTYQWQLNGNDIPGATTPTLPVTSAGTYTVTVRNIGCATTSSITPISNGPITVSLGLDTSYCEAGPLVLDAGHPGAKYTWSTGDTSQQMTIYNQSGKYWVYVDAGPNCQGSDTIEVNVSPLPQIVGISYLQTGSTYMFSPSGPSNVKSYLWIYSDGGKDTAKNPTHTFVGGGAGVMLVVFNDCGTDTTYLSNLGISDSRKQELSFRLYPNPAQTEVTLSVDKGMSFSEVSILNALGQVVYRGGSQATESLTIDVSKFANGHYILRASGSDGLMLSKPFDVVR